MSKRLNFEWLLKRCWFRLSSSSIAFRFFWNEKHEFTKTGLGHNACQDNSSERCFPDGFSGTVNARCWWVWALFLLLQNDRLPTQARDTSKAPATVSQQTEHTPPRCLLFPFLLVFSLAQGAARVGGGDGRAAAGAGEAAAPAAAAPAGGGLAVLYYPFLYGTGS
jgi:hypothetical protein